MTNHQMILGLDIGGTKCSVVLAKVGRNIQILDKHVFPTLAERGKEAVIDDLFQSMDRLFAKHKLTSHSLRAIGISCGGPLDSKRGLILSPPNLPGWDSVPLVEMLKIRYGVSAYLLNDADACALAEWKLGAGQGARNMVFLTMGTGMGAGIIAEGRLVSGMNGMAGEAGHVRLTEQGITAYGKAGSFEGHASGYGIAQYAKEYTQERIRRERPPQWTADGKGPEQISVQMIAEYAAAGDADALEILAHGGDMLGRGIALLVDILNPETIVIGSIFTRCEEHIRPAMEKALKEEALPRSLDGLTIVPSACGESLGDIASVMAALYALDPALDMETNDVQPHALQHMDRLILRYPALKNQRQDILDVLQLLIGCFSRGGKLLIAGNGGSCADAQHIAGELMKGFYQTRPLPKATQEAIVRQTAQIKPDAHEKLQAALPVIVLGESSVLSTAFSNDVDAELVFAQQVVGYGKPGDVYLGMSSTGNSRNVVLAAQTAKALGLTVIGMTGGTGGLLGECADAAVMVDATTPADVQELHLPMYHAICAMLEDHFFGKNLK